MTVHRLLNPHAGRMLIYLLFVLAVVLSSVAWARHADRNLCKQLNVVRANQLFVLQHHLRLGPKSERVEIRRRMAMIEQQRC